MAQARNGEEILPKVFESLGTAHELCRTTDRRETTDVSAIAKTRMKRKVTFG